VQLENDDLYTTSSTIHIVSPNPRDSTFTLLVGRCYYLAVTVAVAQMVVIGGKLHSLTVSLAHAAGSPV
jgi:hypothetical protein